MRMIEIDYEAQPPIDGYGPGGFRIGGNWHDGSLLLMPDGLLPIPHQLSVNMLTPVLSAREMLDVLLIGMGADIAPLPRDMRQALDDAGIEWEENPGEGCPRFPGRPWGLASPGSYEGQGSYSSPSSNRSTCRCSGLTPRISPVSGFRCC